MKKLAEIFGKPFPIELFTESDNDKIVLTYKNYAIEKAKEEKTPYAKFILPAIAGGILGGVVGYKTKLSFMPVVGAAIPFLTGVAAKTIDDIEIDNARRAVNLDNRLLLENYEGRKLTHAERDKDTKALLYYTQQAPESIKKHFMNKTAGLKTVRNVTALALGGGLVAAYLFNKDKMKYTDVIKQHQNRIIYPPIEGVRQ